MKEMTRREEHGTVSETEMSNSSPDLGLDGHRKTPLLRGCPRYGVRRELHQGTFTTTTSSNALPLLLVTTHEKM